MAHYRYLIVGGGMAADAATMGIREADPSAPIGLIGQEPDPPYKRPPLSKGLWKGEALESIWLDSRNLGATLHLGRTVRSLDLANHRVVDDQGTEYGFDKLLLATGGTPRRFPFGGDRIIYYRTVGDYRRLRELSDRGGSFAVVGGGFIGSEVAAALAMNGGQVTMAFPEQAIGARVYPAELAGFITDYFRQRGVEVLTGRSIAGLEERGSRLALTIKGMADAAERELLVDGVVAGLGIVPNVDLALAAGLQVDNGIVVDEFLRTSHPDVYAAGDVASFFNPALAQRMRVEHEDNALTMGRLAGLSMAGQAEPYHHLPFFYSDLFELGYEAVGELDVRLQTEVDWKEPFEEGVIYYLRDERVRGVLLWNVWEQVEAARRLIAEPGPLRAENLRRRLPKAA